MSSNLASFWSAPIPSVDPEDIKRIWPLTILATGGVGIDNKLLAERCSPGTNVTAVFARAMLVRAMMERGALDKWLDAGTPQDKVFAVAATAPLRLEEGGSSDIDTESFLKALQ